MAANIFKKIAERTIYVAIIASHNCVINSLFVYSVRLAMWPADRPPLAPETAPGFYA